MTKDWRWHELLLTRIRQIDAGLRGKKMDKKQRNLPTSKKAMEYRVYWLERKLTHMKLNETREQNRTTIEAMPESPIKELMHLNNEFHRANELAGGLKKFTEELNRDTLTLNERTERLHEVAAEKLAATDRANRQSKRVQDRGRKINKESLRTTAISRAINKAAQDSISEIRGRIDEAGYLSNLTRAQHEATDTLNQRTHTLNQETVRATAESLKLNRDLADTTDAGRGLNEKTLALQEELRELKSALANLGEDTQKLNNTTEQKLERLDETDKAARDITSKAKSLVTVGKKQLEEGKELHLESQQLNQASQTATERSLAIQAAAEQQISDSRIAISELNEDIRDQVADLLSQSRADIEAHQARQTATLLQLSQNQEHKLSGVIEQALDAADAALQATSMENSSEITAHIETSEARLNNFCDDAGQQLHELESRTEQQTNDTIQQFGDDARLRFSAFEERANQLTEGFITGSEQQLKAFAEASETRLNSADEILQTLTDRTAQNLEQGEQFLKETSKLNADTRLVNEDTRELNANTETVVNQSVEAINKIDTALQEVNAVSRKLYRETRELQDRSQLMNEASERLQTESAEINRRSLDIQSDTLQSQGLSQEINNHSLALNEETQKLQLDFVNTRDTNNALVDELTSLREQLVELSSRTENHMSAAQASLEDGAETTRGLKLLGDDTRDLNQRTNDLLTIAAQTVESTQQHNLETESLIQNANRVNDEMEALKRDVLASGEKADQAATAANCATSEIHEVRGSLDAAIRQTESVTADAFSSVQMIQQLTADTESINDAARAAQQEMRSAIEDSQQINDEFMRGLASLSKHAEETDAESKLVLAETRSLQEEMKDILQLKSGIDVFQQSVDICQEKFNDLTATVADYQVDIKGQSDLVTQYQRRIDAFQEDVNRYRESVMHFETRAQGLEDLVQDVTLKLEDIDQNERDRMSEQVEKMRRLELDMRQTLTEKQLQLESSIHELQGKTEQRLATLSEEMMRDVADKLQTNTEQTEARLIKTAETVQTLNGDFSQLNRSMQDEIRALKTQTSAVKEQHSLFQQEQRSQLSDQKKRTQHQDLELDSLKHQLENYQRLLESQIDNQPTQQLQQRIKTLENGLRQQQRMIKQHETQQEKLGQDDRVDELRLTVEKVSRSLQDVMASNEQLKGSLNDSRSNADVLRQTNQDLEQSLQSREEEINSCMQRIARLEARESSFEEMIESLKTNDTDTQQTLMHMRAAVKDSTRAMRETQKTLERLNPEQQERKRDWMSAPKQAVMSSVFAILVTGLTMFGFNEVNAALDNSNPVAALTSAEGNHTTDDDRNVSALDRTLASLKRANNTIADLGEFAWPVNFGMIDPKAIEYRSHHQGISIKGELGDPVVAVNDGKVIFSGNEIRGYGNMIVIQHDDDLVSIYANNQFNYVDEGDAVRRGQLIGDIGKLYNEEAAGLYFEVRHNGQPEDPFNYLRNNQSTDLLSQI